MRSGPQREPKGPVRTWKECDWGVLTSGDHRGRDALGHGKNATSQGASMSWALQVEDASGYGKKVSEGYIRARGRAKCSITLHAHTAVS